MDDLNTVTDETADQAGTDQSVADGSDSSTTETGFLSDADLMAKIRATPELNQVFTKMQGAYTRKTQGIASVRNAAQIVDRFNTDPEFARQTILSRAQQLGLTIQQPGQQPGPNGASKSMPPDLVELTETRPAGLVR